MWLRIASYPDREMAMEMASKLRNLGGKVEVREVVEWELEERYFLKGKISELEEYEEAQEWKRRSEIIREIIKDRISVEEFEREFLMRALPEEYEKIKKVSESEVSDEEFFDGIESALRINLLMSSVYSFLRANGFELEDDFIEGTLPDDPTIIIELENEVEGCEKSYYLQFVPSWDVNLDVMSLLTIDVDVEGLVGTVVDAAARIVMNVVAGIEETNDADELRDYTSGVIEDSNLGEELYVDAEEVYDIIMKSLEKAGIIKISGRRVKLRK